jgi:hypothetical protein
MNKGTLIFVGWERNHVKETKVASRKTSICPLLIEVYRK